MTSLKIKHETQSLEHFALALQNFGVNLIDLSSLIKYDILLFAQYCQFNDLVKGLMLCKSIGFGVVSLHLGSAFIKFSGQRRTNQARHDELINFVWLGLALGDRLSQIERR